MSRACLTIALALGTCARGDEAPSQKLRAGGDENKQYFLIGATKGKKAPKDGFGLVVIMPGGDGSAEFHPFVKRLYEYALPEGYLAAQPIAMKWTRLSRPADAEPMALIGNTQRTLRRCVVGILHRRGRVRRILPIVNGLRECVSQAEIDSSSHASAR